MKKKVQKLLLIYCRLQQHIVARWKLYLKMELPLFVLKKVKFLMTGEENSSLFERQVMRFSFSASENIAVMKEYNIRLHYEKELEGMGKVKSTI